MAPPIPPSSAQQCPSRFVLASPFKKGRFVLIKKGLNAHVAVFCFAIFDSSARALAPREINRKLNIFNTEISMQSVDYVLQTLIDFSKEESGASLIEYVLIGSIIAVVCALSLLALSKEI